LHTVGRHLIAEFYGCDSGLLNDPKRIREVMIHAAERTGVTMVGEIFHQFAPQGVSGTIVIAESHMSVHTWPENGYAAVDIFTCGGIDPRPGFQLLGKALQAKSFRMQEIVRGIAEDVDENRHLLPEDVQLMCHTAPVRETRKA